MIAVALNRSRRSEERRLTALLAEMSAMVLTPAAVLAGALGSWRFGCGPRVDEQLLYSRWIAVALPDVVRARTRRASIGIHPQPVAGRAE